ncbi:S8 family serine peptidase [Xylanibacter muris]|uniref:S8 family serine peptidase n=2 Tax=Xylanibacter muris TaxID=2736290 RepID=A0ABX2AKE6_9BACT|nr:S8 family serine peptidase [Xylanibacter muris]NPD91215.1 S8 family serine peptidase [Xylanibacter muris]
MDIHRSSIKDFVMPKVKSVIVIDYYEGIQGMLASRGDFPYDDFLANPRMRTQTEIVWATDVFSSRPSLLCDIKGELKDRYSYALKERINAIEAIIESLKTEDGGVALSELLSKAISYIDERSVYCGDGNIVVVNWGLIPRRPDLDSGSIYRSGKFVGNWGNFQPVPQVLEKPNIKEEPRGNEPEVNVEPVISVPPVSAPSPVTEEIPVVEHEIPVESAPKETVQPVSPQIVTPPPIVQADKVEIPKPTEKKEEEKKENPEKPEASIQDKENYDNKDTGKNAKNTKKEDEYNWKSFFSGLWQGLKFFFRKIWWVLLLLLLLFAVLFFCKGCQGPISQINPFYNPLPENPRILPIESGAVGMSADGMTQIATDRLNIMLEKENDNTMLEWAKAFKKEYSGENYEIFYYNEEFYNLQIKVPSAEREQIKKEIKQKLSGFSFDVFDETVFNTEAVSFNDPELSNEAHAWYLNAIEAIDAWNLTLGDPDVIVAVVDNGFDTTHPEFQGKIIRPFNVLTQNANLRPILTKDGEDAHGTHVAATAVGNCNNGQGLMGIAPKCKLMPVQVGNDNPEGCMSNQAIIEGVLYAINQGADVVNVSLGMYTSDTVKEMSEGQQLNYISSSMKQEELMWAKIFEKAKQRNCIIVLAAGNDNVISGIDPKKRSNESIRVSAVNTEQTKAKFSNYGVYPNLNRIYSTISAPGVEIFSAAPHGKYTNMQGTSMAAPIVTGAVALMKSIDRNITLEQAVKFMQETGKNVGSSIGPMLNLKKTVMRANG